MPRVVGREGSPTGCGSSGQLVVRQSYEFGYQKTGSLRSAAKNTATGRCHTNETKKQVALSRMLGLRWPGFVPASDENRFLDRDPSPLTPGWLRM